MYSLAPNFCISSYCCDTMKRDFKKVGLFWFHGLRLQVVTEGKVAPAVVAAGGNSWSFCIHSQESKNIHVGDQRLFSFVFSFLFSPERQSMGWCHSNLERFSLFSISGHSYKLISRLLIFRFPKSSQVKIAYWPPCQVGVIRAKLGTWSLVKYRGKLLSLKGHWRQNGT